MTINQDTANLIDTLASAAAKLSFTNAGKQIEAQIIAMIPGATDSVAEALHQDNIELQTSGRIMAENLEILRGKMQEIVQIVSEALPSIKDVDLADDFRQILKLAEPINQGEA